MEFILIFTSTRALYQVTGCPSLEAMNLWHSEEEDPQPPQKKSGTATRSSAQSTGL